MVAALSILLRPLLPTASISSHRTASMPKISTNPAIINSITVMPDSERFPRCLLVGMCLVPPTRAIPIPTLYAASRRNAGGGPAGSASAVVPEVVNKTRGGITHTSDRIGKARQPARIKVRIHIHVRDQHRAPHNRAAQQRRSADARRGA